MIRFNVICALRSTLVAGCCLAGVVARADDLPQLVPLEGESVAASLAQLDAAGQGLWQPAVGEPRKLSLEQVVRWGHPAEWSTGPLVLLVDGSLLVALQPSAAERVPAVRIDNDRLLVENGILGSVSVPMEWVRAIFFAASGDRQRREELVDQIEHQPRKDRPEGDLLLLENGDQVVGQVTACDGRQLVVSNDDNKRSIATYRVLALAFDPALLARPPTVAKQIVVGLRDGSLVRCQQVMREASGWQLLPAKPLRMGDAAAWKARPEGVSFVQPFGGAARYLSDLAPESYRHLPYLSMSWNYRNDLNVLGSRLRAGGELYAKGIGMHSTARLTWRLDKPYQWFEAAVAIDDQTNGLGSVRCRVFVDAEERWTSDEVRGGAAPVPVRVSVAGGKQLSLIVDFGERADEQDHVDWLDARLVE